MSLEESDGVLSVLVKVVLESAVQTSCMQLCLSLEL